MHCLSRNTDNDVPQLRRIASRWFSFTEVSERSSSCSWLSVDSSEKSQNDSSVNVYKNENSSNKNHDTVLLFSFTLTMDSFFSLVAREIMPSNVFGRISNLPATVNERSSRRVVRCWNSSSVTFCAPVTQLRPEEEEGEEEKKKKKKRKVRNEMREKRK